MSICAVNLNAGDRAAQADPCGKPAIYRVWTANCARCLATLGLADCAGHPVCLEHGAALRAQNMQDLGISAEGVMPATLTRICSLGGAS